MSTSMFEDKTDLARLLVKPLYFGMVVNIGIPMVLLLVCYYFDNNKDVENKLAEFANTLFYIFGLLSLLEAGFALWWRSRLFERPMIRRQETFEEDLVQALVARSKPVFIVIASISVYGYIYFFLTGRFTEAVLFVVFSFLVFQVVRPRYGMVRRIVAHQEGLVNQGKFLTD